MAEEKIGIAKDVNECGFRDQIKFGRIEIKSGERKYENLLKSEIAKFQQVYENFSKEKASHMQALKGQKKKAMLSEHEKAAAARIAQLEESLKKKKQYVKTFSILGKTLGSFLENASDEDFPSDG